MEATVDYSSKILNNGLHLGTIRAQGSVFGKFEYNGPKSDIRRVRASCGSCTTVKMEDIEERDGVTYIPFEYSDTNVSNAGSLERYPNGIINVHKQIQVFFEDGTEEYVDKKNSPGKMFNPETASVWLDYYVDVKL